MVSKARLLLPLPDSPVITTRRSRGNATSTSLRLCSRAPRTTIRSWGTPQVYPTVPKPNKRSLLLDRARDQHDHAAVADPDGGPRDRLAATRGRDVLGARRGRVDHPDP